MITYRTQDTAPHLHVRAEGTVTQEDVDHHLDGFHDALLALPPGYVCVVESPDLRTIEVAALDRLYYYIAQAFEAEPGLVVLVSAGRTVHPGLRDFIFRLAAGGVVQAVETRAEADRLIEAYQQGKRGR